MERDYGTTKGRVMKDAATRRFRERTYLIFLGSREGCLEEVAFNRDFLR